MTNHQVLDLVMQELRRAEEKHPGWPDDPIHGAAIVGEEAGELIQAALDHIYDGKRPWSMAVEAAQVAAMGIRFLLNLDLEGTTAPVPQAEELG